MPRRTVHFATLFTVCLLVFAACQASQAASAPRRVTIRGSITIPDIPGEPFSATAVVEVQLYFPDGSVQTRRTISLLARDSQGRTHNEVRRLMPENFHGSPELLSLRLFDPLTRIRMVCDPALHIARQQTVPKMPKGTSISNPYVRTEDLGTTTLNGLQAKGTRRTWTISAMASGTGRPVQIQDEEWYSGELHINLLIRHTDPRIGVQTIGVSELKRDEPGAAMFQVPRGYKIVDETPGPPEGTPEENAVIVLMQ